MQSKRAELVPVEEVVSRLDGPVAAIREATPQGLHHFTRFDQVNQLVSASEADADLGFIGRTMALCSLPRTNPGNRLQYKRNNGPYTLIMTATGNYKLPFGNLPRLLMAWVSTEAVPRRRRVVLRGSRRGRAAGRPISHQHIPDLVRPNGRPCGAPVPPSDVAAFAFGRRVEGV